MDFFTNTYELTMSAHDDAPENERPYYQFRAATIKERRIETQVANRLTSLADPDSEDDVDDAFEYIVLVLPHIQKRLLSVRVGKKNQKALLDIEGTLDYTSIVEMFWRMRNGEEISILAKKKSRLLSNSNTAESAPAVKDATGPRAKKAK